MTSTRRLPSIETISISKSTSIAYLFEPLVRDDLNAGRLRQVLPAASIEEPGLFLYFPRHASEAPKLRAFIDVARQQLRESRPGSRDEQQVLPY